MSKIDIPSNPLAAGAMTALLEASTTGPALRRGLEVVETALGRRLAKDEGQGLGGLLTGLEAQARLGPGEADHLRAWIAKEDGLRRDYETKLAGQGLSAAAKASLIGGLIGFAAFLQAAPDAAVSFSADTIFAAAITLSTMVGVAATAMGVVMNDATVYGVNRFEEKLEPRIAELERAHG